MLMLMLMLILSIFDFFSLRSSFVINGGNPSRSVAHVMLSNKSRAISDSSLSSHSPSSTNVLIRLHVSSRLSSTIKFLCHLFCCESWCAFCFWFRRRKRNSISLGQLTSLHSFSSVRLFGSSNTYSFVSSKNYLLLLLLLVVLATNSVLSNDLLSWLVYADLFGILDFWRLG